MYDLGGMDDAELKALHAAVHEEIKRRDMNAVLQDLNAARPAPKVLQYRLRALDVGAKKYVVWSSFKLSTEEAKGAGPFEDLTVLTETEVSKL